MDNRVVIIRHIVDGCGGRFIIHVFVGGVYGGDIICSSVDGFGSGDIWRSFVVCVASGGKNCWLVVRFVVSSVCGDRM